MTVTAVNGNGSTTSSSSFDLKSISGLNFWLDGKDPLNTGSAPSVGSAVNTWFDKSGFGYNATAAGSPTYSANGIVFTGIPYYKTLYPTYNSEESCFIIVNVGTNNYEIFLGTSSAGSSTAGGRMFMNQNGQFQVLRAATTGFNPMTVSAHIVNNTPIMLDYSYTASSLALFANGTSVAITPASGTFIPINGNGTFIGSYTAGTASRFAGTIAEIVIFNISIPLADRQKVEGYLAWKWSLQAKLPGGHPYYSAQPSSGPFVVRTSNGTVTTFAGSGSMLDADGTGTAAAIYRP
jgi:hypothetical protein